MMAPIQNLVSRISLAEAMATVALFAALAGGAVAFSGSGTLQKAGETNVSAGLHDLRSLNDFGTLQVSCDTADDEMEYQLDNDTAHNLNIRVANEATGALFVDGITAGNQSQIFGTDSTVGTLRVHVFRGTADNKGGVEVVVSNEGPLSNQCATADVRVMALNTVE